MKKYFHELLLRITCKINYLFDKLLNEQKTNTLVQLTKFCISGFMNTAISYITYALLNILGFHYIFSSVIAFIISTLNAYLWNNYFVFQVKKHSLFVLLKTCCSYCFTGMILHNILLYFLVEIKKISKFISPLLILFLTVPLNFLLNKYWTFRSS